MSATLAGGLLTTLWNSNAFHIVLSLTLHGIGVSLGLWIWYLFPRDPAKVVSRQPVPRYSLSISAGKKSDKLASALLLSSGESSEEEMNFSDDEEYREEGMTDAELALAAPSSEADKKAYDHRGHG